MYGSPHSWWIYPIECVTIYVTSLLFDSCSSLWFTQFLTGVQWWFNVERSQCIVLLLQPLRSNCVSVLCVKPRFHMLWSFTRIEYTVLTILLHPDEPSWPVALLAMPGYGCPLVAKFDSKFSFDILELLDIFRHIYSYLFLFSLSLYLFDVFYRFLFDSCENI